MVIVVDKETKEIVGDGDAVELATFYNNRGQMNY